MADDLRTPRTIETSVVYLSGPIDADMVESVTIKPTTKKIPWPSSKQVPGYEVTFAIADGTTKVITVARDSLPAVRTLIDRYRTRPPLDWPA